jgi:hypothetical protein
LLEKPLSKGETPTPKPGPPAPVNIRAEIVFPDKPPMKTNLTVKAENENKAVEEALKQLQKQHPRARSITLTAPTIQRTFKLGKK